MSEYTAIHSHALQDALSRLGKTYRAFFRRVQRGKKAGFPRFQGRDRYHFFPYKEFGNEFGNGAMLDNVFLVLSKIGRLGVRWSRAFEGAIKTVTISQEADDWTSASPARRRRYSPCPRPNRKPASTLALRPLRLPLMAHASSHGVGIARQSGRSSQRSAG